MSFEQKPSLEKEFIFKKLTSDDWEKYKEIRLKALETDPRTFGSDFQTEYKKEEKEWRGMISDSNRSLYAALQGETFVGTAASKKLSKDNYAIYGVYTFSEFRGKLVSEELIIKLIKEEKQNGSKLISLI